MGLLVLQSSTHSVPMECRREPSGARLFFRTRRRLSKRGTSRTQVRLSGHPVQANIKDAGRPHVAGADEKAASPKMKERMNLMRRERDWRRALACLPSLQFAGLKADLLLFSGVANSCVQGKQWQVTLELFDATRNSGVEPDSVLCNICLSGIGVSGALRGEAHRWNQKPLTQTSAWVQAFDCIRAARASGIRADVVTYGALIHACEQGKRWQQALWILLEAMRQDGGTRPSLICANAAISACAGAGCWDAALRCASTLGLSTGALQGLEADVFTLNSCLSACQKGQQWRAALGSFSDARLQGLVPDVVTNNALLAVCSNIRDWNAALVILETIRRQHLQPTVVSYTSAIAAAARSLHWRASLDLLLQLCHQSFCITTLSYNAALAAFGNVFPSTPAAGPQGFAAPENVVWRLGLLLLSSLCKVQLKPDSTSVNSAMNACVACLRWEYAFELLQGMPLLGLSPDILSCNIALAACDRSHEWTRALFLLQSMTQRGPHPDLVSFNSVMGACGRRQQLEQVLELLRSTRRVLGVVPDEFSFTYSVAACERRQQWALALALLCEAAQAGLQWSPTGAATATNAALSACGSHGLWRVAAALLESLVSVRLSNVVTYTAAMAACASRACWTSALKLLLDMPEARLNNLLKCHRYWEVLLIKPKTFLHG
ncbi:unnamed protein product [Polarella glacialis]|uniref:Pentatricopeptide repeat-containing protein, chloroplastic n=1 Tax=Polarella glacialis TaxID=89957 RepID=A0A813M3L0_POLGL|nr:unnamed protein product [Polarella glacialis]